jgi:phage terminase large subunit-like protein
VVEFFRNYLRHVKGRFANLPFHPLPFQDLDILRPAFGWMSLPSGMVARDAARIEPLRRRAEGIVRRYNTCFLEMGRKGGKSTLVAGIGNYMTFADREESAEVYTAATKKDQAKIIWDIAKKMVKKSPALSGEAKIFRNSITVPYLDSVFMPLGADADTLDGLNSHCNLIDELHAHKNRLLVDVLTTGEGGREQPMTWFISSMGFMNEGPYRDEREYAKQVLDGTIKDDSYFAIIYALDEKDDWRNERVWGKANPGLGISPTVQYLRRQVRKATQSAPYQNTVKTKHFGIESSNVSRFFDIEIWDAACGKVKASVWRKRMLTDLKGKKCVGGLDLGSTSDFTALVLAFEEDDAVIWLPWFWLPREASTKREAKLRTYYASWVRAGYVRYTDGNVTDYDVVLADIVELGKIFKIDEIEVDRLFQGAQLCTNLLNAGFTVWAHGQGYLSMAQPLKRVEELYLQGQLLHGNNPVLRFMATNMDVATDAAGNMKPQKPNNKNPYKIDGIVAGTMATGRLTPAPKKRSRYEDAGTDLLDDIGYE